MKGIWRATARSVRTRRVGLAVVLAVSLALTVCSLVWLAYGAVGEWRRGTLLLVDQRSQEALTLLTVALTRDMKGVHDSVLASFDERTLDLERPFDLEDFFAQAFARFPYPESFFVWREPAARGNATLVFNRMDRPPLWAVGDLVHSGYPVSTLRDAAVAGELVERARTIGKSGQRFAAFETTVGGVPYEVVVRLIYHTAGDRRLFGVVGFTVNLSWVRKQYFGEILRQISAIGNIEDSISLAVSDSSGTVVAGSRAESAHGDILHSRQFPFSFLDPDLTWISPLDAVTAAPEWTASVRTSSDRTLAAASRGSTRTLWLVALTAAVAIMALLLTLRTVEARAQLVDMQSEFISSATHELKTPLSVFQLVGETLAKGRYHSATTIQTYATLLSQQSELLGRLIDNILLYASLGSVKPRYTFAVASIAQVVEAALERFDARLAVSNLSVQVDVSPKLPNVLVDSQMMMRVFDNIIDNAIKYSPGGDVLTIRGYAEGQRVHIDVSDQGIGIAADEQSKVFEKFYRGHDVTTAGSGLGLSIALRIVTDHGGSISIRANTPKGTTINIQLPYRS